MLKNSVEILCGVVSNPLLIHNHLMCYYKNTDGCKKTKQVGIVHIVNSFVFVHMHKHKHTPPHKGMLQAPAFRLECMSNGANSFSDGCSVAKG